MPINILMVVGSYPPDRCGVGDYTRRLVEEFQERGLAVQVLTSATSQAIGQESNLTSIYWSVLRCLCIPWKWSSRRDATIIHLQYPSKGFGHSLGVALIPIAAKIMRIPCVITLHEFTRINTLRRVLEIMMAIFATKVIVSDSTESRALGRYVEGRRISIIPIQPQMRLEPIVYNSNPEAVLIVFFGFIRPDKGLDLLLEASIRLIKAGYYHRLKILSEISYKDPYHRMLIEMVNVSGCSHIEYTGYVSEEEIQCQLEGTTLFVFPYLDGISQRRSSALVAFQTGVPVLTSQPEHDMPWLADGVNVLFFRRNSVDSLFSAMRVAMQDVHVRDRLHEGTLQLIRSLSWAPTVMAHKEIYLGAQSGNGKH